MSSTRTATPRELRHRFFARIWPAINTFTERHGALELRRELLADAAGRVLEIGAGDGANFAHYPPGVTEVVAVEPEPRLLHRAEAAAAGAPVPVQVRAGLAEHLPAPPCAFDTVVVSLVLCSVQDVDKAVAEIVRVLRPGGKLLYYEHIQSAAPRLAKVQRVLDRTVWPHLGGNCHLSRNPEADLEKAGLVIERARHFDFLIGNRAGPSSPSVIGTARKP